MNSIKTIIVDDERLARNEMKRLIKQHPQLKIIAEAQNGQEAIEAIKNHQPDLVFLDIQMPGKDGFQVLEATEGYNFEVIFTTAYDEYALKAFDFAATDYLLKPIEAPRLKEALDKLGMINEPEKKVEKSLNTRTLHKDSRIFIKDGERYYFLRIGDIKLFESEGNYVKIHHDQGKPLVLSSLNALDQTLNNEVFFRANRKLLVNTQLIQKVEPYFSGSLIAHLSTGEKIEFSRRQTARFKDFFSIA